MRYAVTLERGRDGGYLAWVHELPGCFARAASRPAVEAKLRPAIEEFCRWLRAAGEAVPEEPVEYAIVAEVETPLLSAQADSDVLLEPDRAALDAPSLSRLEAWLRLSRRDLLRTLDRVDTAAWEWKPEGGPRSVREHLQHLAFVEFMYAAWTFDLRSKDGIAEFLSWTRRIALDRLRDLARSGDARVTQAAWSGAPRPESWTARKALRRLLWHERLHLRAIRRLLDRRTAQRSSGGNGGCR